VKTISLFIGIGFFLFHLAFIPVAAGVTVQDILAEIQNRYEKTGDFEATFVQESVSKVMRRPQRGEGKVYFKKKGMMRWDYRIPNQQLISNGQTLWFYQPDENQVLFSDISKVLREKTPLAFLAGEGDLRRDFNLVNFNDSISQQEDNFILELVPKETQGAFTKLTLTVDKNTYYITQVDVFDGLGNVTRTRFMDIKTNRDLPDSFFHFAIPPGTEEVRMQETPETPTKGKETLSK
jgi:outer membrane lipoprotein carrier protein